MSPSSFPDPINYAYGVFYDPPGAPLKYLGLYTFPLELCLEDLVSIGGVVCDVVDVQEDGFITVAKHRDT